MFPIHRRFVILFENYAELMYGYKAKQRMADNDVEHSLYFYIKIHIPGCIICNAYHKVSR